MENTDGSQYIVGIAKNHKWQQYKLETAAYRRMRERVREITQIFIIFQ